MSAALQNIGALLGIWGIFWYAWDHAAEGPGWVLGIGLMCITGSFII